MLIQLSVVTVGHIFSWTPQSALFFLKCIIMVVEQGAHSFLKIWSLLRWWGPSKPPKIPQNCLKIRKFLISTSGGIILAIGPCSGLEHVRAQLGWCVGTYIPTWNCHRGSPEWLKTAPKCYKLGMCSHKQSRRFHMSAVTCVKAGTCQSTPGLMC